MLFPWATYPCETPVDEWDPIAPPPTDRNTAWAAQLEVVNELRVARDAQILETEQSEQEVEETIQRCSQEIQDKKTDHHRVHKDLDESPFNMTGP